MSGWHLTKNHTPEGDRAQAIDELMMREGSRALLIAIARAQAEREGPEAVRAFYQMQESE